MPICPAILYQLILVSSCFNLILPVLFPSFISKARNANLEGIMFGIIFSFVCQRMASQAFTSVTCAILTCQLKWVVTNVKGGSWFYSARVTALAGRPSTRKPVIIIDSRNATVLRLLTLLMELLKLQYLWQTAGIHNGISIICDLPCPLDRITVLCVQ